VVAVVLVGVCMVYLGAHWPTDVLAGWALGAVLGATLGWVGRRVGPGPRAVSPERGLRLGR
jgi:undecaprenyl-diphosphatase